MTNMILQKLLPTIIHCSALSGVGVLKFEALKLTKIVKSTVQIIMNSPQRHQDTKVHKVLKARSIILRLCGLVFAAFA